MTPIPAVNWSLITAFIRQHTHDLRNELNGLDLETALLADVVTDPEAVEGVTRMRGQLRQIAADLRGLSAKFAESHADVVEMPAQDLFLIWQDQLSDLSAQPEVEWTSELAGESVNVDPTAVAKALREVLSNAQSFGPGGKLRARARVESGAVIFELREPKVAAVDPERWGLTPFVSTRRGGYGLGLCSVLREIEASGGKIVWRFDATASELVTTTSFPVN